MSTADLINRFTYHAPKNGQPEMYQEIRQKGLEMAGIVDTLAPDSREKSLAITKIEEAVMWAIAAIARQAD